MLAKLTNILLLLETRLLVYTLPSLVLAGEARAEAACRGPGLCGGRADRVNKTNPIQQRGAPTPRRARWMRAPSQSSRARRLARRGRGRETPAVSGGGT